MNGEQLEALKQVIDAGLGRVEGILTSIYAPFPAVAVRQRAFRPIEAKGQFRLRPGQEREFTTQELEMRGYTTVNLFGELYLRIDPASLAGQDPVELTVQAFLEGANGSPMVPMQAAAPQAFVVPDPFTGSIEVTYPFYAQRRGTFAKAARARVVTFLNVATQPIECTFRMTGQLVAGNTY